MPHENLQDCVFTCTRFECARCEHVIVYCRIHADRVKVYGHAVHCTPCSRFSGRNMEGVVTYCCGAKITTCTWAIARDEGGLRRPSGIAPGFGRSPFLVRSASATRFTGSGRTAFPGSGRLCYSSPRCQMHSQGARPFPDSGFGK